MARRSFDSPSWDTASDLIALLCFSTSCRRSWSVLVLVWASSSLRQWLSAISTTAASSSLRRPLWLALVDAISCTWLSWACLCSSRALLCASTATSRCASVPCELENAVSNFWGRSARSCSTRPRRSTAVRMPSFTAPMEESCSACLDLRAPMELTYLSSEVRRCPSTSSNRSRSVACCASNSETSCAKLRLDLLSSPTAPVLPSHALSLLCRRSSLLPISVISSWSLLCELFKARSTELTRPWWPERASDMLSTCLPCCSFSASMSFSTVPPSSLLPKEFTRSVSDAHSKSIAALSLASLVWTPARPAEL
mmetsp:Transcript_14472/g.37110  ORF Transcript_14472/g.37110 Transcript_14472/m.37110 type:complete len:311 (-) Transcript_14472:434-1366(-)